MFIVSTKLLLKIGTRSNISDIINNGTKKPAQETERAPIFTMIISCTDKKYPLKCSEYYILPVLIKRMGCQRSSCHEKRINLKVRRLHINMEISVAQIHCSITERTYWLWKLGLNSRLSPCFGFQLFSWPSPGRFPRILPHAAALICLRHSRSFSQGLSSPILSISPWLQTHFTQTRHSPFVVMTSLWSPLSPLIGLFVICITIWRLEWSYFFSSSWSHELNPSTYTPSLD